MQNPYAPPKSQVLDVPREAVTTPLWNPNAAANWSLLFTPAFGAYLHMKNWQALGQSGKAASARVWFVLTLVLLVGLSCATAASTSARLGLLIRPLGFVLLVSWYFGSARGQAAYLKNHLGDIYPKRSWLKPLLVAVLAFCAFAALLALLGALFGAGGGAPRRQSSAALLKGADARVCSRGYTVVTQQQHCMKVFANSYEPTRSG